MLLLLKKTFQNIIQEDLKKYYKDIPCETLILWGEKDYDTPLKDGYIIHKNLSNSGLIIYPNCGHFCYCEESYQTVQILSSFIKK